MHKTATLLITGGAGFIGSALIDHLLQNTEFKVVNLDKITYAANQNNLARWASSPRYAFEKIDITHQQALEQAFNRHQPHAVMHLAAESHVDRSIDGPAVFMLTNILGTYTLLEVARHYWQGLNHSAQKNFRFHHISTDEVYGDLPHPDQDPKAKEQRFNENSAYAPSSPYSASKASADHLVRAWHRTYGLPIIISNCSNNYGPGQYPEKLIPRLLHCALNGQPLPLYGQGQQIRDWLFVEDHARALHTVITQGRIGETYAIGGNNELRNQQVVEQLCDQLQNLRPNQRPYRELITFVDDRPGHDQRYAIDTQKIKQELGWQPQESFASGLRKTIEWYLINSQSPRPKQ